MKTQIRYVAYSLIGISMALTLLLPFPESYRSEAKVDARVALNSSGGTSLTEEDSVTLSPTNLRISEHYYFWMSKMPYCGAGPFEARPGPEEIPGSIIAEFKHEYDKGAVVLGCPDGSNTVDRGSVWFDLSDIINKAPPLHISVQSATLHFGASGACPGELLVASEDWLKGYPDNTVVPGDPTPIAKFFSGISGSLSIGWPTGGVSVDVTTVVNNWVRGEGNGGYPNYGFVFKGMQEADLYYPNADSCVSRFKDFTLMVKYKYDKEATTKPKDTYPLECRGIDTLKMMDFDGPVPYRWVGFNFIPGTKPAPDGLSPGQCSWLDRGMRPGEPARLAQPIENTQVWNKELDSSDSYWTFNVYNAGDQFQATGAERKKPSISIFLAAINLALKKSATQISTFTGGEAYRAVDGNTDGEWAKGSVAATGLEAQAWWEVDLGSIRSIKNIKVWNRVEFPKRTSDFYVFVSDEPFKSTDLAATKSQPSVTSFFTSGPCGYPTDIAVGKTGRYVRVQLSGTDYLQLAEVEVFPGAK